MSTGSIESTPQDGGVSRRAALKAGVGLGVGAIAWSGPTITSLGATPAYAAGCTFVVNIDLSGGCRNTDNQSGCDFGYHTLKDTGLPSGYSLTNNVPEGTCCSQNWTPVLHFPAGITCAAKVEFRGPGQCLGDLRGTLQYGPESDGDLDIVLKCLPYDPASNTQYTIVAKCATTGAPVGCLT